MSVARHSEAIAASLADAARAALVRAATPSDRSLPRSRALALRQLFAAALGLVALAVAMPAAANGTTTTISATSTGTASVSGETFSVEVAVDGIDPTGSVSVEARRANNSVAAACSATLGGTGTTRTAACVFAAGELMASDAVVDLRASYVGEPEGNDAASTSAAFPFNVARGSVAVSGTVAATVAAVGAPVLVTITLTPVAPAAGIVGGSGTPDYDIIVRVSSTEACGIDLELLENPCLLVFDTVGEVVRAVYANYQGNADFEPSAPPTYLASVSVVAATTASTLVSHGPVSDADPSPFGESVRLTATVINTVVDAFTAPAGNVTFFDHNDVALGTVALVRSARRTALAELPIAPPPLGTLGYRAVFASSTDFIGSESTDTHTVVAADTSTTITAIEPGTPDAGQTVSIGISVAAVAPGAGVPGTSVQVDGADTSGCTAILISGSGSCELSFATKGSKSLTAHYLGSSAFNASSQTLSVAVSGIATNVAVTGSTPATSYYGDGFDVSFSLGGGDGSFDGTVIVSASDGTHIGICKTVPGIDHGNCTIPALPALPVGSYALTASYAGDATDAPSSAGGSPPVHAVVPATAILSLSRVGAGSVAVGEPVAVALGLALSHGAAPLVGTVGVAGSDTSGCMLSLSGTETWPQTCTLNFSAIGTGKSLTANFTPASANVAAAISNSVTYDVARAATNVAIAGFEPAAPVLGEAVTVSFDVGGGYGTYGTAPSVTIDAIAVACAPLAFDASTGIGACGIAASAFTGAGVHSVSVSYPGDVDDAPSEHVQALTIARRASALSIVADAPDRSLPGQPVNVSVSLTPQSAPAPSGSVTIGDGVDSCTITLPAAACTLTLNTRGPRILSAGYPGDANHLGSSASATHLVNRLAGTVADSYRTHQSQVLIASDFDGNATPGNSADDGALANDSDPDGDALTAANAGTFAAGGIGGSVTLNTNGSFAYTPPAGIAGSASFPVQVSDGFETVLAMVNITVQAPADLAIAKTDGLTFVDGGQAVSYLILVRNLGATAVLAATVQDLLPAALINANWSCTASAGAACPGSGSGSINVTVDLPVASQVEFVLNATVAPGFSGALSNTATVAVPGTLFDTAPANNSATDSDDLRLFRNGFETP